MSNETKWSAGPWTFQSVEETPDAPCILISNRGGALAWVYKEADAQLVTAAPHMAAAIQLFIDSLEGRPVEPEEAIGALRDAHAKAQGDV